jgi:hypothetical protein
MPDGKQVPYINSVKEAWTYAQGETSGQASQAGGYDQDPKGLGQVGSLGAGVALAATA